MRADNLSKSQRSYCMSRIKSFGTNIELKYKKKRRELKYQPNLFGKPDFIDYKNKAVIFIDGCFWHKCLIHYIEPKSNKSYWLPKLEKNKIRDKEINIAYKAIGWKVIRIWEHKFHRF